MDEIRGVWSRLRELNTCAACLRRAIDVARYGVDQTTRGSLISDPIIFTDDNGSETLDTPLLASGV